MVSFISSVRPSARNGAARSGGFALLALLFVSLNMRTAITAVAPVLSEITAAVGLTAAQAGLLTSLPVLCFAVLTPPASSLIGRIGANRAIVLALAGVIAGQVIRSLGGLPLLMVGAVLVGAAITIGNVAIPVVIARDFFERSAGVTGAYSAAMNLGSTFSTLLTAPIALAIGWQLGLASWSLLAVAAVIVWALAGGWQRENGRISIVPSHSQQISPDAETRSLTPATPETGAATTRAWTGSRLKWVTIALSAAFVGQSGSYFAMTAWLPEILVDKLGVTVTAAGNLASPFQFAAILGSLGVPLLIRRGLPVRTVSLLLSLMWLAMPVGLLLAPSLAFGWLTLAGIAQGGNFTLIFSYIVRKSISVDAARRTTTAVLTVGYVWAAIAPTLMGWGGTVTGGWAVPLLVVTGALTIMALTLAVITAD